MRRLLILLCVALLPLSSATSQAQTAPWFAHYVGDAHVPFHAVMNDDGQLTNQHGLHSRFESALFERYRARLKIRPGILAIRLDSKTDAEITLFANLMTLTPGELSIDVSADRSTLYVHSLYLYDIEESRRATGEDFEGRVLRVMR